MLSLTKPDTAGKWVNLLAATLGFTGSIVVSRYTYGEQPYDMPTFGDANTTPKHIADVTSANKRRVAGQRVGLAILSASFAAQALTSFLP